MLRHSDKPLKATLTDIDLPGLVPPVPPPPYSPANQRQLLAHRLAKRQMRRQLLRRASVVVALLVLLTVGIAVWLVCLGRPSQPDGRVDRGKGLEPARDKDFSNRSTPLAHRSEHGDADASPLRYGVNVLDQCPSPFRIFNASLPYTFAPSEHNAPAPSISLRSYRTVAEAFLGELGHRFNFEHDDANGPLVSADFNSRYLSSLSFRPKTNVSAGQDLVHDLSSWISPGNRESCFQPDRYRTSHWMVVALTCVWSAFALDATSFVTDDFASHGAHHYKSGVLGGALMLLLELNGTLLLDHRLGYRLLESCLQLQFDALARAAPVSLPSECAAWMQTTHGDLYYPRGLLSERVYDSHALRGSISPLGLQNATRQHWDFYLWLWSERVREAPALLRGTLKESFAPSSRASSASTGFLAAGPLKMSDLVCDAAANNAHLMHKVSPLKIDEYHIHMLYKRGAAHQAEGYYAATMARAAAKSMIGASDASSEDGDLGSGSSAPHAAPRSPLTHRAFADPSMMSDRQSYEFVDSMTLFESSSRLRLSQCYLRHHQLNPAKAERVSVASVDAPSAVTLQGSLALGERPLTSPHLALLAVQLPPMAIAELHSARSLFEIPAGQQDCRAPERHPGLAHQRIAVPLCLDALGFVDRYKQASPLFPLELPERLALLSANASCRFFPEPAQRECHGGAGRWPHAKHYAKIESGQCTTLFASLSYHAASLRLVGVQVRRLKVKESDKWAAFACHARSGGSLYSVPGQANEHDGVAQWHAKWIAYSIQLIYDKAAAGA